MERRPDARRKARRHADAPPASDTQHGDTRSSENNDVALLSDSVTPALDEQRHADAATRENDRDLAPPAPPDDGQDTATQPVPPVDRPTDQPVAVAAPVDSPTPRARLVLPSSGLAEDILRAAEGDSLDGVPAEDDPSPPKSDAAAAARAHQFTFFAAPEREARELPEATEHLVTFVIDREEYGVEVRLVQEIIRVPAITRVPRAPAFAKGVINLRGRIIPVMDFKAKLGLGQVDAAQRKARILVVRLEGRLIGLLVDGASQVLKIPVSSIEAAPEEVVEADAGHIRGVAKLRDRLVILVDLMQVLARELHAAVAAE